MQDHLCLLTQKQYKIRKKVKMQEKNTQLMFKVNHQNLIAQNKNQAELIHLIWKQNIRCFKDQVLFKTLLAKEAKDQQQLKSLKGKKFGLLKSLIEQSHKSLKNQTKKNLRRSEKNLIMINLNPLR